LVRVPMMVDLVLAMDRTILSGAGGYGSRAEFIEDAVRDKILELTIPDNPESDDGTPGVDGGSGERPYTEVLAIEPAPIELADTAVRAAGRAKGLGGDVVLPEVADAPLLGLHNRDYPSVWALARLADMEGDVDGDLVAAVVEEAWLYGSRLTLLETRLGRKLTQALPVNRAKPRAASNAFRQFAIGTVRLVGERWHAEGPLFAWRALGVRREENATIAVTDIGRRFLEAMDGLSLELPHAPDLADRFLAHLAEHAPADLYGFFLAVDGARENAGRLDVIERFRSAYPRFSDAHAAGCAQGYVARGREWGLIDAKMSDGAYTVTDAGARALDRSPLTDASRRRAKG
jgi:hypothetical protein